ncbi:MAG: exodeoxyribonuclease V subunit alpha [Polyangiaceae bacterium]|nr:exodeoxyribonuclease V subunit alpha [Polyangiaceae bacterium]
MSDCLTTLVQAGAIAPIDLYFAQVLSKLVPGTPEPVRVAGALVSRATRDGHACLSLSRLVATDLHDPQGVRLSLPLPNVVELAWLLGRSPLVGDGAVATPLVLDRGRLYLRRLWQHEQALAAAVRERTHPFGVSILPAVARASLQRCFGPCSTDAPDWQRVAAQLAVLRALTVITGGPGTGKTTTVVGIVALVIEQALAQGRTTPRVLLLAPTGKAASRLVEAIRGAKARLAVEPAVLAGIPEQAATIHRTLGVTRYGLSRTRPPRMLNADLVIVDEASMVDLTLMHRLVAATPPEARLVLLGDHRQLASVDAGAVLADLCGPSPRPPYSPALGAAVSAAFGEPLPGAVDGSGGIADSVVELRVSHRFEGASDIGRLAAAILAGDPDGALAACGGGSVSLVPPGPDGQLAPGFLRLAVAGFAPYLEARDPEAALAALGRFRVLAAHRGGLEGLEGLNQRIERELVRLRRLRPLGGHYHRRPLLVTQNDHEVGVHNGDVGVVWAPAGDEHPRIWLATGDATARVLSPARVPAHETVFAMSVHKSQGSEFDEVAVVLPKSSSRLLTRELLYTAVTRARERVTLFAAPESLRAAVTRTADRASGLRELLWGKRAGE